MRCEYSFKYVHVWDLKSFFLLNRSACAHHHDYHIIHCLCLLRWTLRCTGLSWTELCAECAVQLFYTNNNWTATFNFSQFGFLFHFFSLFSNETVWNNEGGRERVCVWALNRSYTWSVILLWLFPTSVYIIHNLSSTDNHVESSNSRTTFKILWILRRCSHELNTWISF